MTSRRWTKRATLRTELLGCAAIGWTLAACSASPGPTPGNSAAAGSTGATHGSSAGAASSGGGTNGGASSAGASAGASSGAAGSTAGGGNGSTGSAAGSTGGSTTGSTPAGAATLRVHYPAAGQALTFRGSEGGLSWTADLSPTVSGDTFTYTTSSLTSTLEWKPMLAGTWALGPNYHAAPGQTIDEWPHFTSATGQVETLIASFQSTVLADTRAIYAYLPASYAENTDATYPVVYMHDGQNLWAALPQLAFATPWNVDTTFDTAAQQGACSANGLVGWGAQPLGGTPATCNADSDCPSSDCETFPEAIVIGIANDANRVYEYTPTVDPTETSLGAAGGADQYLQMIVSELKPTIDGMLRTRPDPASTSMCGSSLGGLVTAYAGVTYPGVFTGIAALSPSTWWDSDWIVGDVQDGGPTLPSLVYVDSGQGQTADDETDTDLLASAYLALGYVDGTNFRHVIQPGAQHSEVYWAERFPGAMQLLLGMR